MPWNGFCGSRLIFANQKFYQPGVTEDRPTRSWPRSVIGTGFCFAWILYIPASDAMDSFSAGVHKYHAAGCPGDSIWHGVALYCVSSVFSVCIGVFGSQTDPISLYFAMNRTLLRNEGVRAYKFSQKRKKNLGAVSKLWELSSWPLTNFSWHRVSAIQGYESLPWTRGIISFHFETLFIILARLIHACLLYAG